MLTGIVSASLDHLRVVSWTGNQEGQKKSRISTHETPPTPKVNPAPHYTKSIFLGLELRGMKIVTNLDVMSNF